MSSFLVFHKLHLLHGDKHRDNSPRQQQDIWKKSLEEETLEEGHEGGSPISLVRSAQVSCHSYL